MKRIATLAAALLGALTIVAVPAAIGAKGTKVIIHKWEIETAAQGEVRVNPGGTFTHCATDAIQSLGVDGRFKRAKEGVNIQLKYIHDGTLEDNFLKEWAVNGNGTFGHGIVPRPAGPPIGDGFWAFKVTQKGHKIGRSTVNLVADPAC
jgi:hypothetical protein